jgi:hypothetical protein
LKILIKNVLLYRKRTKKVHMNFFASIVQSPQWKGSIYSCVSSIERLTLIYFITLGRPTELLVLLYDGAQSNVVCLLFFFSFGFLFFIISSFKIFSFFKVYCLFNFYFINIAFSINYPKLILFNTFFLCVLNFHESKSDF